MPLNACIRLMNFSVCVHKQQTRPAFGRVIRGYQSIANYLAKHTPTLRDYTLRDVQLSFFVSRVGLVDSLPLSA